MFTVLYIYLLQHFIAEVIQCHGPIVRTTQSLKDHGVKDYVDSNNEKGTCIEPRDFCKSCHFDTEYNAKSDN